MTNMLTVENKNGTYIVSRQDDGMLTVTARLTAYSFPVTLTDLTQDEADAFTQECAEIVATLPWERLDD